MGATVQECMPLCLQRLSIRERKWTSHGHNTPSNIMGRRQSQRKDNNHFTEKRSQQRRKNKANIPSAKCTSPQTSAQGTPAGSVRRVAPSAGERREAQRPPHCRHRGDSHGPSGSKHGAAMVHPPCRLSDSSPDLPKSTGPTQGPGMSYDPGKDTDSDRDLSDTERLSASPSSAVLPQLDLRPEVITPDDLPPDPRRLRGRGGPRGTSSSYPFPDFLPPPFNTWSLAQLASFYHTESQRTPRPRPSDPLERFLERLLQLEWRRMQTVQQEEGGGGARDTCEVPTGCHHSHASSATHLAVRLSSPKSILQCQRAFPLTFLSSLAIDSALLSGCGCLQCRQRYAQAASSSSFSSSIGSARRCRCPSAHARPSSLAEHVPAHPLPKRSHSETRAWASVERGLTRTRGRPPPSSARGNNNNNSHLRRMQALGNLRNPTSSAPPTEPPPPSGRDLPEVGALRDSRVGGIGGSGGGYRSAGWRNRSCSEHRGGGAGVGQVQRGAERYEKRRSGSECHRGAYEWRTTSALGGHEIQPDAVAAIMDNLALSKTKRSKQVEFVT